MTFATAAQAYIAYRQPKPDEERRIAKLVAALGPKKVAAIVHADLVMAADALYPGLKASSRNRNVITIASAILHYAAENGWREWMRVKRFKEPRPETRAVSHETASALIAAAQGQARLLLIVLFGTGLRISDALSLRWDAVDLQNRTARVRIAKTDRWRVIPLDEAVFQALANESDKTGKVFRWRTRWGAYRALRPALTATGVRFTPHMARHSLGTWLNAAGAGLRTIMATLGHDDPKSSMRYQDADLDVIRAAHENVGLNRGGTKTNAS